MPRKEYFPALRRNPRRERQIAEIARRIGAEDEFASVIDYALAKAMHERRAMNQHGMYSGDDRVRQVNALRTYAAEIADATPTGTGTTASDMIAYYLDDLETEMPQWFDDHDRGLLARFVQEALDG